MTSIVMLRAMGDMVEEMDSHRRKSFALLTRKGADGRAELDDGEPAPPIRQSRSFSKVAELFGHPLLRPPAVVHHKKEP